VFLARLFLTRAPLSTERFPRPPLCSALLCSHLLRFRQLKVGGVRQRLTVPYFSSAEALRSFVGEVFAEESIPQEEGDFGTRLVVHGAVAATLPRPASANR